MFGITMRERQRPGGVSGNKVGAGHEMIIKLFSIK